jgi:hypothetical protein
MKRIKQKSNKKFLFATPVVIVLALAIAGGISFVVFAISRNESIIDNSAKIATSGVSIVENSDPGFGKKEISFYNNADTNSPVLLRIGYSETWTDNDGNVISNLGGNSANVVTKNWTNDFVQRFVDGHDGWYYYDRTLAPLGTVQVLSSIALSDQSYNVYNYDLSFRFEAVQADAAAALELWGKTVTVENGVATWQF